MAITVEENPTPLVLIMANVVRRSIAADVAAVAKLKGVAAVRSVKDPQAVTIRFDHGDVHLEHGVASDAALKIAIDFDLDGLPEAPKPKVSGAARNPLFAFGVGKVLEPPMPDLITAVREFWELMHPLRDMPAGLRVTATDTGATAMAGVVGDEGDGVYELCGPVDRLLRIMTGQSPLLAELAAGRCHARGTFGAALALSRAAVLVALGDSAAKERMLRD